MGRISKITVYISLFILLGMNLYGQQITSVWSTTFGEVFKYYERWDPNEGSKPGILSFMITPQGNWFTYSCADRKWYLFNSKTREIALQGRTGEYEDWYKAKSFGNRFVAVKADNGGAILVFDESLSLKKPLYTIPLPAELTGKKNLDRYNYPLYLTGNMIFGKIIDRTELASWELLPEGKTLYRGVQETESWLAVNGTRVGFRRDSYGIFFGENSLTDFGVYLYGIFNDLIYPKLGPLKGLAEFPFDTFEFLGSDRNGLNYFIRYEPHPYGNKEKLVKNPIEITICIIDTWTRKITTRTLPAGAWDPPRNREYGLLGIYPWAVSPSGDIYFFDADVQKQEYLLKKVQNDWWAELGVDKRRIGRVRDNDIPLQVSASSSAKNNGYNYQHEFVWILEESKTTATVDGKAVPWVRVRKIDGREGWMLLSDIYFE